MEASINALPFCVAAQHVEGKAAAVLRQSGTSGATIHHNHPWGTCLYCTHALPSLLSIGSSLTIVAAPSASAATPWFVAQPATFTGRAPSSITPATFSGGAGVLFGLTDAAVIRSREALDEALRRRIDGVNHFTLSPDPVDHPVLTLAVDADRWVVHYFASPDDPGRIAIGDPTAVGEAPVPDAGGQPVGLPRATMLEVNTAFHAADTFLASGRPWNQLAWRPVLEP